MFLFGTIKDLAERLKTSGGKNSSRHRWEEGWCVFANKENKHSADERKERARGRRGQGWPLCLDDYRALPSPQQCCLKARLSMNWFSFFLVLARWRWMTCCSRLNKHRCRDVTITPSNSWGGQGMLGVTIRFDTYDNADDNLVSLCATPFGPVLLGFGEG